MTNYATCELVQPEALESRCQAGELMSVTSASTRTNGPLSFIVLPEQIDRYDSSFPLSGRGGAATKATPTLLSTENLEI